ncbi:MAG: AMP-binding protein [Pseudomonadota bacterium]
MTEPRLTLSHVTGATEPPLLNKTIGAALDEAAATHGERDALIVVDRQIRLSYAALKREADTLARGLLSLGLAPGDRIGIWAPNCLEWTLTQFATAKAGLILVNINPAYRLSELRYALNKVGCRALVTAASFKTSDYFGMIQDLAPELASTQPGALKAEALPALEMVIGFGGPLPPGFLDFEAVRERGKAADPAALEALAPTLDAHDPINIQFTSGTTGSPKGATLTHHNILNNGHFVGEAIRLGPEDRIAVPVPLYHCFGMVMGNLAAVTHGACVVYPAPAFEPAATLAAVEAERCTALYGVPTMFVAMLNDPTFAKTNLSSLRTGIMAGSPCPIEVMKQVIADMNMNEVTIAYGMTETSPVSFQSSVTDPLERRVSTVGRIQPHLEVKIAGPDGAPVPNGEVGELCTKGYSVMQGYWDDADRTAEALKDGWMHTGDLATLDEEGYCNIVGRLKDMVIRGGENLYPREIEEYLYTHPDIAEVAVFGVPDDRYGEELCAWIQIRPGVSLTEDTVKAFCKGQIAHMKVPRYIRFVDAFPMTVTGKIQKFEMRNTMMEDLQLTEQKTA